MSRIESELADGMQIEPGDCIVVIKKDGSVGKVVMPEMTANMTNSLAYKKLLDVLDLLQPGARKDFINYNKRKMH